MRGTISVMAMAALLKVAPLDDGVMLNSISSIRFPDRFAAGRMSDRSD
jgi:hypothetical protein